MARERSLEEDLALEAEHLTGTYWDSLVDGVFYLQNLHIDSENYSIVLADLIEILSLGQARGEEVARLLDGDIYSYIDRSRAALEKERPLILRIAYDFLGDFLIILLISFINGLLPWGKSPRASAGRISISGQEILQFYLIFLFIRLTRTELVKKKSRLAKFLSGLFYILALFFTSLILLSFFDHLGFLGEFRPRIISYLFLMAGLLGLRQLLKIYIDRPKKQKKKMI